MSNLNLKPLPVLPPEVVALLNRLTVCTEADIEAELADIEALAPEELRASLAAAGIDVAAVQRRWQQTLATLGPARPTLVQRLARGIDQVREGLHTFLSLTRDGLETLRRGYTPVTLFDSGRDLLEQSLEQAGVDVAAISLTVVEADVRLAWRWRRRIPQEPPRVSVTVGGEPRAVEYDWIDWNGELNSTQGLRLRACALTKAHVQAADVPVLRYRWEAESNHLYVDLLPPGPPHEA